MAFCVILMVSAYYAHKQPGAISEAVRRLNEDGVVTHLSLTDHLEQIEMHPVDQRPHSFCAKEFR